VNLRELNYIFIPRAQESWTRWENSRAYRFFWPLLDVLRSTTVEGRTVFVAMLVAGAAGIDVRFSNLYLVFCALFSMLFSAMLMRSGTHLRDGVLAVSVHGAGRVTAGEVAVLELELHNVGDSTLTALRVVGPFLPWDANWEGPAPGVSELAPGARVRVQVALRLRLRGERVLGRFEVARAGGLGLVLGRSVRTAEVRLTVLPRPYFGEGAAETVQAGLAESVQARAQRRTVESFELLGVRPYRAGDRPRDLHARAWARHGEPIVRELRETRPPTVGVVLDLRVDAGREVVESAVSVAAGLLLRLSTGEATIGLLLLGPTSAEVWIRGQAHVEGAMDLLAAVQSGRAEAGDADLGQARLEGIGKASGGLVLIVAEGAPLADAETLDVLGQRPRERVVVRRRVDAPAPSTAGGPGHRELSGPEIARALGIPT
jgi:uncharacterized protein (DUF58 family)